MTVLFVLVASVLASRGLGTLGAEGLDSWPASARFGLAVMFFFTASAHFSPMKDDLVRMMPRWVPMPRLMVAITGVLEILGAFGILISELQHAAGIALVLLLIAMLPANIHAARAKLTLRGEPVTPLRLRIPMQLVFIVVTLWSTQ
jgi:uncharacterized membrane protein